jgi:hypothetical protein
MDFFPGGTSAKSLSIEALEYIPTLSPWNSEEIIGAWRVHVKIPMDFDLSGARPNCGAFLSAPRIRQETS